jgi:cytochrome c6
MRSFAGRSAAGAGSHPNQESPFERRSAGMKTTLSVIAAVIFLAGTAGVARADGAELFSKKCASCHGKDGNADTAMGKKLNMRKLSDPKVQANSTDAQMEKLIAEGVKGAGGKNVMPATKLSPEEVKEVVKFTRSLKK